MPGTVASLRDFRARRDGAAFGDENSPATGASVAGGDGGRAEGGEGEAAAFVATDHAGAADRARRFRELALPQLDTAYNLARHLARDADAAEDIVQEAYLRALRGFDGYRG